MKTLLITGSCGFIGRHLLKRLRNSYDGNILAPSREDLDLVDSEAVRHYLDFTCPDIIIHLASNPNNKPDADYPNAIINDNIISTHNLCYYSPVKCRFIFASSVSVYGKTEYPLNEFSPCSPNTMYGVSKLASEKIIDLYTAQKRINGVSLRLCATVGPDMTHGMLHDFFRKIQLSSPAFEVFGSDPGSIKPYIYVDDVISTIFFVLQHDYINFPINVSPDGLLSVKEIATMTLNRFKSEKSLTWMGASSVWAGDEPIIQVSNQRMKEIGINLRCQTSYEAIAATLKEYRI